MKKYHEAILDCDSALSIDQKCTKSITQKGNAFLGLKHFDEAKECSELLRSLGENALADNLLKKLHDVQFPKPIQIPKTKKSKRKQK